MAKFVCPETNLSLYELTLFPLSFCSSSTSAKASRRVLSCRWAGERLEPVPQGRAIEGSEDWTSELAKLPDPVETTVAKAAPRHRPYAVAVALAPPLVLAVCCLGAHLLKNAVHFFLFALSHRRA